MRIRSIAISAAAAALISGSALSQSTQSSPSAGAGLMPTPFELPEACRTMIASSPSASGMLGMMEGMDDAHKGYMGAMMRMNPAMMQGMMAKDPDVAFACSMVAHHMGAIEMAKVVMKYGDDPEAKRMAEKTRRAQEQEISDLRQWIQKHATK